MSATFALMAIDLLTVSVPRLSFAVVWLLSPVMLVLFAVRQWKLAPRQHSARLKNAWPIVVATAIACDWILFVVFLATGQIGGFGTHFLTNPTFGVFFWASLVVLIASFGAGIARAKLCAASALVSALWFGSLLVA